MICLLIRDDFMFYSFRGIFQNVKVLRNDYGR